MNENGCQSMSPPFAPPGLEVTCDGYPGVPFAGANSTPGYNPSPRSGRRQGTTCRMGFASVFTLVLFGGNANAGTDIPRSVINCGGGTVVSEHHAVSGTIGQGLISSSTSEHHEITWGFFAFVGQPCATSAVCNDASVCTFDNCTNTLCAYSLVRYGDVNGSGASGGAAQPDLDDILCVLQGFANAAACMNADLAPPCTGNDLINLDDILAVLAAFSGADPCGCT